METIPDIAVQIKDNATQRTPCVLVLDGSTSMSEENRVQQLNLGLRLFQEHLRADPVARVGVQVLVLRFGGEAKVEILSDWTDAAYFEAPTVIANGNTPMGAAMNLAIHKIGEIKKKLNEEGVTYSRPWVFLMTDGGANDSNWEAAAEATRRAIAERKFILWPIAIGEKADVDCLRKFQSPDGEVWRPQDVDFRTMFVWLSGSLSRSASTPAGGQLQIAAPPMITIEN